MDNESWLIETGDLILQKKADQGTESLTSWEILLYCLWVADYSMRNAGDLETARDVFVDFLTQAAVSAQSLSLSKSYRAFSLPSSELEQIYFEAFDSICEEVRAAKVP
ncbi:MAG: hypothetical protein U0903_12715 [Planctomycetales bacterium]